MRGYLSKLLQNNVSNKLLILSGKWEHYICNDMPTFYINICTVGKSQNNAHKF